MCGATTFSARYPSKVLGLSPRVRGNRCRHRWHCHPGGPIPACAGQPQPSRSRSGPDRAYPRVCGATPSPDACGLSFSGLSPRVRGNREVCSPGAALSGPIPACAGQPCWLRWRIDVLSAYPRVCGATMDSNWTRFEVQGLSPRVRGNLAKGFMGDRYQGPIPACAGQPAKQTTRYA